MTKQILKLVSIFVVIISLCTTFVLAENEVDTSTIITTEVENAATNSGNANEPALISTENQTPVETNEESTNTNDETQTPESQETESANTNSAENAVKKDDVYLIGDDVIIDFIVDGNLFVIANNVTISSQIGGDAFILANNVTVTNQGYVYSNLFTSANNIEVGGVIYDLYAISKDITISGYVYRDARVSCNNLNIFGAVGRNVYSTANTIKFLEEATSSEEGNTTSEDEAKTTSSHGQIGGDLNYTAQNEISVPDGTVGGNVNYKSNAITSTEMISVYLISLGTIIATTVLIWLVALLIAPKFLENTNNLMKKKLLSVIGIGILTPIVAFIVSLILMVIRITSSLGFILLGLLFILFAISTSIFIIAINNLICNKLNITKKIGILGILILTSIVIWAISLIPYVGSILGLVAVVIGLGLVTTHLIPKKTKKEENDK